MGIRTHVFSQLAQYFWLGQGQEDKSGENSEINLSQDPDCPGSRCQKFFLVGFIFENSLKPADAHLGAGTQRSMYRICPCTPGLRPNHHNLSCWKQLEVFPPKCQRNAKRQWLWPTKDFAENKYPIFHILQQFIDVNISSLPRYCSCSFREWQERWQRFLLCVRDEKTWTHRQEMTWAVSAFQAQGQVPINPGSALKLPILSFPPLITCCCKIMCFRRKPNNNEIPLFYIKLAI